ncbi:ras-related protein Rab-22A-like [Mya arenaria]|uniref:ras-related protein Rab-22A-like n=1 Tax=Mya arenaria TaxID=6604 RepID=UPI0022DF3064|nr:ras-related protein Rab-22A-like [Mya arenaria]
MKSLEAKVVVLGSQGVGKTSVVIRYVGGMFSKAVSPTIGASFFTYKLTVDDYRVKLQVWDTAGQERFRSMAPMYYRKANAAMLIYDITSSDTFYDIKDWVSELKRNVDTPIILCLVGNKCDLVDSRQVNVTDAQEYADSIGALFFETSALKNTGIEEAFLEASKRLIKLYETTPTSGLHTLDQLNSSGNNDDKIHIDPPSKHTGPPPPPASKCSC